MSSERSANLRLFADGPFPALAVTRQQIAAAADPAVPLQVLADIGFNPETAGQPVRLWAKDPCIAQRLNDALHPDFEGARALN